MLLLLIEEFKKGASRAKSASFPFVRVLHVYMEILERSVRRLQMSIMEINGFVMIAVGQLVSCVEKNHGRITVIIVYGTVRTGFARLAIEVACSVPVRIVRRLSQNQLQGLFFCMATRGIVKIVGDRMHDLYKFVHRAVLAFAAVSL